MSLGQVPHESGGKIHYFYFPTTSIVPLLYVMGGGSWAGIAVVGSDDIVGVSLFMGGETMTSQAVVQSAGNAHRLQGKLLNDELYPGDPMQRLLLLSHPHRGGDPRG